MFQGFRFQVRAVIKSTFATFPSSLYNFHSEVTVAFNTQPRLRELLGIICFSNAKIICFSYFQKQHKDETFPSLFLTLSSKSFNKKPQLFPLFTPFFYPFVPPLLQRKYHLLRKAVRKKRKESDSEFCYLSNAFYRYSLNAFHFLSVFSEML